MSNKTIPSRKDVPSKDKWDLTSIYANTEEWEAALKQLPELTKEVTAFKGQLGSSSEKLLAALKALEKANFYEE